MRNTWLISGIAGFILALLLTRSNTVSIAANAPAPAQKWEYATFEEREKPLTYSWHAPGAKTIWEDNFPDLYKEMGGKGDPTTAPNAQLYNLVAAQGWEYVGVEESLSFRKTRAWVFKRPVR